jgi:hypothetical protein
MSDALADTKGTRMNASREEEHDAVAGKHRGTIADDDVEGRREPAGHGRHRRTAHAPTSRPLSSSD